MVSETLHSFGYFFIHSVTIQHCLRACCELEKELNFSERVMTIQRKVGRLVEQFCFWTPWLESAKVHRFFSWFLLCYPKSWSLFVILWRKREQMRWERENYPVTQQNVVWLVVLCCVHLCACACTHLCVHKYHERKEKRDTEMSIAGCTTN